MSFAMAGYSHPLSKESNLRFLSLPCPRLTRRGIVRSQTPGYFEIGKSPDLHIIHGQPVYTLTNIPNPRLTRNRGISFPGINPDMLAVAVPRAYLDNSSILASSKPLAAPLNQTSANPLRPLIPAPSTWLVLDSLVAARLGSCPLNDFLFLSSPRSELLSLLRRFLFPVQSFILC